MVSTSADLPRVLFFNINGSGTGHLSRCLAYARRMQGRARPVFFSLASAIEFIEAMGFEADYLVSPFWSRTDIMAWNRELAVRVGLLLDEVRPSVVVFDGTWPFLGLLQACDRAGVPRRVWSNRQLHKADAETVPVAETEFDLVIEPGEIGTTFSVQRAAMPGRKIRTAPVTLLRGDELTERDAAREALGLERDGRYVLFSLGPGNLKDVSDIASGLVAEFRAHGFTIVWAKAPITVRDVPLPDDVTPISVYPLLRYMRAFDLFAGAAGYNTCYEVMLSGVPSLLVPNLKVQDDQTRRAQMVAEVAPVVVSPCETAAERAEAVEQLVELARVGAKPSSLAERTGASFEDGAESAAEEILALLDRRDDRE